MKSQTVFAARATLALSTTHALADSTTEATQVGLTSDWPKVEAIAAPVLFDATKPPVHAPSIGAPQSMTLHASRTYNVLAGLGGLTFGLVTALVACSGGGGQVGVLRPDGGHPSEGPTPTDPSGQDDPDAESKPPKPTGPVTMTIDRAALLATRGVIPTHVLVRATVENVAAAKPIVVSATQFALTTDDSVVQSPTLSAREWDEVTKSQQGPLDLCGSDLKLAQGGKRTCDVLFAIMGQFPKELTFEHSNGTLAARVVADALAPMSCKMTGDSDCLSCVNQNCAPRVTVLTACMNANRACDEWACSAERSKLDSCVKSYCGHQNGYVGFRICFDGIDSLKFLDAAP